MTCCPELSSRECSYLKEQDQLDEQGQPHHRRTRLPPSIGPVFTREAATFTGLPVVPTELVEDPSSRRPHNRHKRSPVTIVPGFTDEVTTFTDSPVGPTEVVQGRLSRR
ncbi:hypothetical protein COOONC_26462, partial [Cooperia oncophora]